MEDKVFELLEKMYSEMNEKFEKIEDTLKDVKKYQSKFEVILENEIKPKISFSLEGYADTNEKLLSIESKINWIKDWQKTESLKVDIMKGKIEERLIRIEDAVTSHEEIIRRVK